MLSHEKRMLVFQNGLIKMKNLGRSLNSQALFD